MAKTLTASIRINSQFDLQRTFTGLNNLQNSSSYSKTVSYTTGTTTAGGANEIFAGKRFISAGGYDLLDLAGALTNPVNDTSISFARVKGIFVQLLSQTDDTVDGNTCSSIKIGGHTSNPFLLFFTSSTHEHTIHNGSVYAYSTPNATAVAVSAGLADTIRIINNDGSVTAVYNITVIGSDA